MSFLDQSNAVQVDATETKSTIANTQQNLEALDKALSDVYGEKALKVNSAVIKSGGLMGDGSRRVPLAVILKSRPGGSLTCWVDKSDPESLVVVWSGVITSNLLEVAGIEKI